MAAACCDESPAIFLQHPNDIGDFHAGSIPAGLLGDQTSTAENGQSGPAGAANIRAWIKLASSSALARSPRIRSRTRHARSAFRWAVLHRRHFDRNLLPAGLPGADAESAEHSLLHERRGRGRRRIPTVPALPAGSGARFSVAPRAQRARRRGIAHDRAGRAR